MENLKNNSSLIVGIATSGRREVLSRMLSQLAEQQTLPNLVIICPANDDDFDTSIAVTLPFPIDVVRGARGLTAQRNLILSKVMDRDLIVFFDDDFYPARDFLKKTIECFAEQPGLAAVTGRVIADGATGPGIEHCEALRLLAVDASPVTRQTSEIYNVYGCNMAFRISSIRHAATCFDENLPLYSWLEDVDFSRALAGTGNIGHCDGLRGVHLATKRGRTSGLRFGYSQIANPLYLARKGNLAWWRAFRQMGRNVTANLVHSLRPEPWVDRRGRLKGNGIAVVDLLRGYLHPRRILSLS